MRNDKQQTNKQTKNKIMHNYYNFHIAFQNKSLTGKKDFGSRKKYDGLLA